MGERCAAYIQFGGRISKAKADELVELINDNWGVYGDGTEATLESLTDGDTAFGDYECNFGNLDDLKDFAVENGLHYYYWCDRGSEWDQQIEIRDAETGEIHSCTDSESGPALTKKEIERLGSIQAIMTHFELFDPKTFPKLEIVG